MKPAGGSGSGHWQLWAALGSGLRSCAVAVICVKGGGGSASVMERGRIWFGVGSIPLLRRYLVGAVRSGVSHVP